MSVLPQLVGPYHLNCIPLQHLHKALDLVLPVLLQDRSPNKETRLFESCNATIMFYQDLVRIYKSIKSYVSARTAFADRLSK